MDIRKKLKNCIHKRTFKLSDNRLTISDDVSGINRNVHICIYFNLHPDMDIRIEGKLIEVLHSDRLIVTFEFSNNLDYILSDSYFHPGFNLHVPNKTLIASWNGKLPSSFETNINFIEAG